MWVGRLTGKGVSPHKEQTGRLFRCKVVLERDGQLSVGECRTRSYTTATSDTVQLSETKLRHSLQKQYLFSFILMTLIIMVLYYYNIFLLSINNFSVFLFVCLFLGAP
jgi:hypothetical protein